MTPTLFKISARKFYVVNVFFLTPHILKAVKIPYFIRFDMKSIGVGAIDQTIHQNQTQNQPTKDKQCISNNIITL